MDIKYSENELRSKTLTELRKIGGAVGVSKYSRREFDELVGMIMAIQNGELEPCEMKRGRPKKNAPEQQPFSTVCAEKPDAEEKNEAAAIDNKGKVEIRYYSNETKDDAQGDKTKSQLKQLQYGEWQFRASDNSDEVSVDCKKNAGDFLNRQGESGVFATTEQREQKPALSEVSDSITVNPQKEHGGDYYRRSQVGVDESRESEVKPIGRETTSMNYSRKNNDDISVQPDFDVSGIVELMSDGYGMLRMYNYYPSDSDVYIPTIQIKRFQLRNGDKLKVRARLFPNNRYPTAIYIYEINDISCDQLPARRSFEDLTPIYPINRIRLEDGQHRFEVALRAIDLVAPIGRGQRGLIVSPPKAGKTLLLKNIAQAILRSYNDIHVIMLLVDERPEEVTDIKESVDGAEIVYSTFDMTPEHHIRVSELVMQRAKRLVEIGEHVVILLDSITRLSRAYNQVTEQTGKTLTGGLDSAALYEPKRFFGAARNTRDGGSLTIIATALVDTGSKMDDIIYEEFKGTGNMEVHLSRKMSERRIFPAIDLNKSGTRREELLLSPAEQEGMLMLRRVLSKADNADATEKIVDILWETKTNEDFLVYVKSKINNKK